MRKVLDQRLFDLIRGFLTDYLPHRRNASPHTIRAYSQAIRQLLEHVATSNGKSIAEVTFADIDGEAVSRFLDHLERCRNRSTATRNHLLKCIRAFYSYAAEEEPSVVACKGELGKVPFKRAAAEPALKYASESDIALILNAPDAKTAKGRRDRTLMSFLYDTGARVQEVLNVRVSDVQTNGTPTVMLFGKGRKARPVPMMRNTVGMLKRYLAEFHPSGGESSSEPLFYTTRNGERRRMTEDNVRKMVAAYGVAVAKQRPGFPVRIHPHLFRHSRAMHLYQNGMDLSLVSQWLGHAQIETTLIYAHADTEMKRRAIEQATPESSPVRKHIIPQRMKIDDDKMILTLYGMR